MRPPYVGEFTARKMAGEDRPAGISPYDPISPALRNETVMRIEITAAPHSGERPSRSNPRVASGEASLKVISTA